MDSLVDIFSDDTSMTDNLINDLSTETSMMDNLGDDFSNDTSTTGLLAVGGTATGTIDFSNDVDWFAIELTAGDAIRIASGGFDANLRLRNEFGQFVAFDFTDLEANENALTFQVIESGTYYVDVSSFGSPLDYTLTATALADDFVNSTGTSGVLEIGETATGVIDFIGDADWFAIDLTAGEAVRIASDAFLVLRDEFGNFVSNDFRDFETDENVIIIQSGVSGTFYIDVRANISNPDYTLTATALSDDFLGNTGTTGALEVGGTVTGAINFRNDADWLAIELIAGDTIRIATNETDTNLVLRDEFGNFVVSDFRDFDTNENVINAQVEQSGTFYIDVSSFNSLVDYTLTATRLEDDFVGTASTTGVLDVDGTTTGTINFTNDSDWFAIELTAGDAIRIASDGFDADLVLRDEFGNVIASDFRDSNTNENVINALVGESGTYYIDVTSSTLNQDYTLTAATIIDDFSGNTVTTGTLELGGTVAGTIDFRNDSDWFAIELTAGDTIRIATNEIDANLILRDEFGNFIASDFRDFNTNENVINAQVEQSGTFYIDVSDNTSPLDYTLIATEIDDDFLGNNNTTGVLEIGGTVTGTIDFRNDSDWFAIELIAGDTIRIASNNRNANLVLRDESGNFVVSDFRDFNTSENVINAQVEQSGTYYVDVSNFDSSVAYTLTATAVEDDFVGTASTSGVLEVGGTTTGTINFTNDSDWFAIELTAGETIRIASDGFDADLVLRNEFGNVVAFDFRDFNTNENVINVQVGESGTYYLDVTSSTPNLDYSLTATTIVDDFSGDATTIGTLEIGSTVTGSIDLRNDSDWFAIELTVGDTIRIASDDTNANLTLRDEFGGVVAGDFRNSNTNENVIYAQVGESGTYYVDVMSSSLVPNYRLSAVEASDDFVGTANTTGVLEVGGTATGTIDFRNDSDWFAIELIAGDAIRIASDGFDADLVLRDEFGNVIAVDFRDFNTNENVINAQVEQSGTYYIDVKDSISPLNYTLTATAIEDDFSGDATTIGTLEIGSTVTGSIDLRNDSDWFAIELIAGDAVRIASDGLDADLVLRDEFGNVVESDFRDFNPNVNVINAQVEQSGTFYVDVTSRDLSLDYTLTATAIDDDFSGGTDTTGILEIGSTTTASTDFRNDSDWFAIELIAGDAIRIASNSTNANLVLRDEFGNVVASDFRNFSTNENVINAQVEQSGTFYVDVTSFGSPLDYVLTATEQEDDFGNNSATTGVLEIGGTTSGTIDFRNDEDWFSIIISDTDSGLRLFVDNSGVDLSVFDGDGNLVTSSVDNRTLNFLEAGTYFVAGTGSFATASDYTISSTLVDSVEASLEFADTGIVDTVADNANEITYSLTSDGTLIRYSNETETLLPNTDLGVNMSALSLSQDGRYLFAAQANLTDIGNDDFEATVLRIDTETLAIESFSFEVVGNGYEITDIQVTADGSLFVTTDIPGSGFSPLYNLSGFDDTFSVDIISDPAFSSVDELSQNATLDISRDGQFLLIAESNISSYPVHIFSVEDGAVIATTDHGGFNADRNAISGEASLVAVAGTLYDFDLNEVADLTGIFGSAQVESIFSQNGDYLFLVHEPSNGDSAIAVINTSNFELAAFVDLPQNISSIEEIDISPDGLSLVVTDGIGVHYLDFSNTKFSLDLTVGADRFIGTDFDEMVRGLEGDDVLDGRAGDDSLFGEGGIDRLFGREGEDYLDGGNGEDLLRAGDDNDTLRGGADNDRLFGDAGDDLLGGDAGDDVLFGGTGNDTLFGANGSDYLNGQAGEDILIGGNSDDLILGGADSDTLEGGAGDDRLFGNSGTDTLSGGEGSDIMTGGGGADSFAYTLGSGLDAVKDFGNGADTILVDAAFGLSGFDDLQIVQRGANTLIRLEPGGEDAILLFNTEASTLTEDDFVFETPVAPVGALVELTPLAADFLDTVTTAEAPEVNPVGLYQDVLDHEFTDMIEDIYHAGDHFV